MSAEELLPPGTVCKCGNGSFRRKDIMDVWFDSGSTTGLYLRRERAQWPADMYLEGAIN